MSITHYTSIDALGGPIATGVDTRKRSRYSLNFDIQAVPPVDRLEFDLEKLLIDAGLLVGITARIGPKGIQPDDDLVVEIMDTGGGPNSFAHGDDEPYLEQLSVQIVTRGRDDRIAKTLATDIRRVLDRVYEINVTTT